jgi:hypothetical protein
MFELNILCGKVFWNTENLKDCLKCNTDGKVKSFTFSNFSPDSYSAHQKIQFESFYQKQVIPQKITINRSFCTQMFQNALVFKPTVFYQNRIILLIS